MGERKKKERSRRKGRKKDTQKVKKKEEKLTPQKKYGQKKLAFFSFYNLKFFSSVARNKTINITFFFKIKYRNNVEKQGH